MKMSAWHDRRTTSAMEMGEASLCSGGEVDICPNPQPSSAQTEGMEVCCVQEPMLYMFSCPCLVLNVVLR